MSIIREFVWCKLYNLNYIKCDYVAWKPYITIQKSYKVKSSQHMREVLSWMKNFPEYTEILKAPMWLLVAVWKAHNLLYKLNYKRNHMENLEIESTLSRKEKIGYTLLSLFYWG